MNGLRDPTCPSHVKLLDLDNTRQILTVGTHAASCWWTGPGSAGDEIYLTTPDRDMQYDHTASLVDADIAAGTVTVSAPLPERFIYATVDATPNFASRVASMRRSVFLDAEKQEANGDVEGETDKFLIGGHLMVFLTPNVAQKLEGVEITNFGQQGNLGKYVSWCRHFSFALREAALSLSFCFLLVVHLKMIVFCAFHLQADPFPPV